jgi:hypothetical protein
MRGKRPPFPFPPCGKLIYEKPDEDKRLDFECPALYPKSFQNPAASCTSCRNIEKNGDAVELAGVGIIDTGADHDGGITRARDLTAKEIRCRPVSPPRTMPQGNPRELLQGAEERAEQLASKAAAITPRLGYQGPTSSRGNLMSSFK